MSTPGGSAPFVRAPLVSNMPPETLSLVVVLVPPSPPDDDENAGSNVPAGPITMLPPDELWVMPSAADHVKHSCPGPAQLE